MVKSISTLLDAHLQQEVTTIAKCWRIVRTDGVEFNFTSHDVDLVIDGASAAGAYTGTANFVSGDEIVLGPTTYRLVSPLNTTTLLGGADAVSASAIFTGAANFNAGDVIQLGSTSYTFVTPVGSTNGNVLIGADLATSIANLAAAVNFGTGEGTTYIGTGADPAVLADPAFSTITFEALTPGAAGDSITVMYTPATTATGRFNGSTLAGGADATSATDVYTAASNFSAGDTIKIFFTTYTFVSSIGSTNGNVLVGANAAASLSNLAAAIEFGAGEGTVYIGTGPDPHVSAVATSTTITFTAPIGLAGNDVPVVYMPSGTIHGLLANAAGNVQIGVSLTASLSNLAAAVNHGAGNGTLYSAAAADANVSASAGSSAITFTALVQGQGANSLATTYVPFGTAAGSFMGAMLTGGVTGKTYSSLTGFADSAIENKSDLSVDNLDIQGVFDDASITLVDLRSGAFDYADVYIFVVNWQDTTQGPLRMRRGKLGEVTSSPQGWFIVELRGMSQQLQVQIVELYQPTCRADLFDKRCGLDVTQYLCTGHVTGVTDNSNITIAIDVQANVYQNTNAWFQYGTLQFASGNNNLRSLEIKSWNAGAGALQFYIPTGYPITVSDTFQIVPGCDKTLPTCKGSFNNLLNYRGEWWMPGNDQTFIYPDANGGSAMTVMQAQFVAKAREAIGSPWRHQGRTLRGMDCVGLVLWTVRQFGLSDYEPPPYQKEAKWHQFVGYFRQNLVEVSLQDLQPADVLCFRQGVFPCHCGILTEAGDSPRFIHSYLKRRDRVVEEPLSPQWRQDMVAAFRIPGVV